ncbi:MAG: sulfatase-like hydrolase/transferase, partial [Bacteroidales bacterium]|nr:sulfatase-like hydrolase/transferase [Bacteroidales bacterium]
SKKMKHNHDWWCNAIKQYGFDYVNGVYSANLRELFNDYMNVHNVEWTADASVQFIEQQKGEKNPFFLFVSTTYPHGPAPERKVKGEYVVSLDADPALTGAGVIEEGAVAKRERRQKFKKEVCSDELATSPTARWWDDSVGRIISKLKETGQYENTIIIYTSDHGKKNHGKTTLYENGVHVPLLVQWPAQIKEARDYTHLIGSVDFAPTLLEACGAKVPEQMSMNGVSFNSVLQGKTDATRDALLMKMGYACGVKTNDYKYIAVRYPADIEAQIARGEDFRGYKKERIAEPYYFLHKQLSKKAEHAYPNYRVRNQLYAYPVDKEEQENIFEADEKLAGEMKLLLEKELRKANAQRPFGEFVK